MTSDVAIALLSGGFGVGGSLAGVVLSNVFSRGDAQRQLTAADERRWLQERRTSYARYLSLCVELLREIDGVGSFLSYDGDEPVSEVDEELIAEGLSDYMHRWDTDLQLALADLHLVAGPKVADLADRVSGGLLEPTSVIETRGPFTRYYPIWFQAEDLVHVLRDAMREELGVAVGSATGHYRQQRHDPEWPWLPDRPSRESYMQGHGRHDRREAQAGD